MQSVRIYEIPDCRMVSSGVGFFGDESGNLDKFNEWFSTLPRSIFPKDYLFWDDGGDTPGMHWLYLYEDGMNVPERFKVVDFKGGLYAVTTDIDQKTDMAAMNAERDAFLAENGFEIDPSRRELGNIITPPAAQQILGYCQMDYYTPVKAKAKV